jgi:hypothetical protein
MINDFKHSYVVAYCPPYSSCTMNCVNNLFLCLDALCEVNYRFTVCGDFYLSAIKSWSNLNLDLFPREACLANFIILTMVCIN